MGKTTEVKALLQLLFCVKTNMCWQITDEIQNQSLQCYHLIITKNQCQIYPHNIVSKSVSYILWVYRWQDKFVNTVCSIHHTFQTHLLHFISHSLTDLWTSHVQTLLALKADSRPSSLPQSRRKWRSPQDSKKREREPRMLRTYEPKAKEAFAV